MELKRITRNTDIEELRKATIIVSKLDIMVEEEEYQLFQFVGYYHSINEDGTGNDWYACKRNGPCNQNTLHPFCGEFGADWGIDYNNIHHVDKTSGVMVPEINFSIWRNGKLFYDVSGACIEPMRLRIKESTDCLKPFEQAEELIEKIKNHPLELNNWNWENDCHGREVHYRGKPYTILNYDATWSSLRLQSLETEDIISCGLFDSEIIY